MPLTIVADENIPLLDDLFAPLGSLRPMSGRGISAATVRQADVLLVRSVTRVDAALLNGSRVRFVGSATIGTDHVDRGFLEREGIAFAHAPGSNAGSVVEYVIAALLHLAVRRDTPLRGKKVGIIGCGHIGGQLAARLPALGLSVVLHDPPLAEAAAREGRPHPFVGLDTLLATADIVTVHVPLTTGGMHPTYHLIDEAVLRHMRPGAWLINTSRGAVVSNAALRKAREAGHPGAVVLDVWEGEPAPDPALIRRVDLATPHIAGYSYDGKVQGSLMVYRALMQFLGRPAERDPWPVEAPATARLAPPAPDLPEPLWFDALVRQMYDIAADDARMRRLSHLDDEARGTRFTELRKTYPVRRSFHHYGLAPGAYPPALLRGLRQGLGVQVAQVR